MTALHESNIFKSRQTDMLIIWAHFFVLRLNITRFMCQMLDSVKTGNRQDGQRQRHRKRTNRQQTPNEAVSFGDRDTRFPSNIQTACRVFTHILSGQFSGRSRYAPSMTYFRTCSLDRPWYGCSANVVISHSTTPNDLQAHRPTSNDK